MGVKVLGLLLLVAACSLAGAQDNYEYYDYDETRADYSNGGRADQGVQPVPAVWQPLQEPQQPSANYYSPDISGNVCAMTCRASEDGRPGILYEPGKQYRYTYEGQVVSRARSSPSMESRMSIRSYVFIAANTPCDLKMQVRSLVVDDVPPEESLWFREAVEKYDLHFSYQDGRVEHLCPHEDEDVAATNFKRGILSALQTSLTQVEDQFEVVVQEADVAGECMTKYDLSYEQGDLLVSKTKMNCRSNSYFPQLPHAIYTNDNFNSDLPFFKRDQSCQMQRGDGVWQRVECVEELHVEGPIPSFMEDSSLAMISVTSNLNLQGRPEWATSIFNEGTRLPMHQSLRMDLEGAYNSRDNRHQDNSRVRDEISVTLDYLSATMTWDSGLEEKRPQTFSHLVELLGRMDDLQELWEFYSQEPNYRDFLADALMLCEKPQCIQQVLMLHDNMELPDSRFRAWLAALHFMDHKDQSTVVDLMAFVSNMTSSESHFEDEVLMAASSVVHHLCRYQLNTRCQAAKPFLEYVSERVEGQCGYGGTPEEYDGVKLALRALANSGVNTEHDLTRNCYMNKMHSSEIRVAALQAYRRRGCPNTMPWEVLEDGGDVVEVRLAAYLAMVPCATQHPEFFNKIRDLLEVEEVNQVGSFIWSHVQNLAEHPGASNEERDMARLAARANLPNKFNTNAFRSSRNYRYSTFSDILNIGGAVDSDVIFTSDSYLPRRASVNVTFDLIDKSFNVLEFGGNFHGLEVYVERLFGENGYFENKNVEELVQNLRPKREIHDERIQEFQRIYDEARTVNEMDEEKDPVASMYLRLFGDEVFHLDNLLNLDPQQALSQLIREFTVPRTFQFVNQEYMGPTLLGFPLRLKVNGTGSITFSREGSFLMSGPTTMLLEGSLNPSAVLAVDETLMVDGYGFSSGIRRSSSQVSRVNIGGKIEIQDGKMVDIRLDTYGNEVARVSQASRVLLYKNYRQGWEEQQDIPQLPGMMDCSSEENPISALTGLEFCSAKRFMTISDGDSELISEPFEAEFTINKVESFDSHQLSYKNQKNTFDFLYDTPGSSVDRRVNLNLKLTSQEANGLLVLPGDRFDVSGHYEFSQEMKKLALTYSRRAQPRGELMVSMSTIMEGETTKYSPMIKVVAGNVYEASGTFVTSPNNFMLEGQLFIDSELFVGFQGDWTQSGSKTQLNGRVSIGEAFLSVAGSFNTDPSQTAIHVTADYGMDPANPHTIDASIKAGRFQGPSGDIQSGTLSFEASQAEVIMNLDYDYRAGHALTNTTITVFSTELSSHVEVKNLSEGDDRDFVVSLSCTSEQLDINYLAQALFKMSDHAMDIEAEITLGHLVTSKASLTYLYEDDPMHLLAGLHLQFNDFIIQAGYNFDLSQPDHIMFMVSGAVGPAAVGIQLESAYRRDQPFNTACDVFVAYENQKTGISFRTSSDQAWEQFTGNAKLHWFNWAYSISHKTIWQQERKELVFTTERHGILQLVAEMSPGRQMRLTTYSDRQSEQPSFEMSVSDQAMAESHHYEAHITYGTDQLLQLAFILNMDLTFSGNIQFLESQLEWQGQFDNEDAQHYQSSIQATFTQPSGETFTSDWHLSHNYDGSVRDIKLISAYNGDMIEAHMMFTDRDGWLWDDTRGFSFHLTTPLTRFRSLGVAFEAHGNPASDGFFELHWDEIKIRGEGNMSDLSHMHMKLLYEDGGVCDSHFHIYNNYDGSQYVTGASLALTPAHQPWKVELIQYEPQGDFELNFFSPLTASPFQVRGMYEFTDNEFAMDLNAGTEGEKTSLSISGMNELNWDTGKMLGSVEFNSPWTQLIMLNVTNHYNNEYFNVTADFRFPGVYLDNIAADISTHFVSPDEAKVHFYISHQDFQGNLDLSHTYSDGLLKQQFYATMNTITISFDSNVEWDKNYVPTNVNGRLVLTEFILPHMEWTFSHTTTDDRIHTQLFGSLDGYEFRLGNSMEYKRPMEWNSLTQVSWPDYENGITFEVDLNAQQDFSYFKSNIAFVTPWASDVRLAVDYGSDEPRCTFAFYYDNASVLQLEGGMKDSSDIRIKIASQYSDDFELHWKHNFENSNLLFLDVTYGSRYHIQGESNIEYDNSLFTSGDFLKYKLSAKADLLDQEVHFQTCLSFDIEYRGEFETTWGEYILSLKSSIPDGTMWKLLIGDPEGDYLTELLIKEGKGDIYDLDFRFARNNNDILRLKTDVETLYPEFNGVITANYFIGDESHQANLHVTADLSNLDNYGFKGKADFNSDFDGFEHLTADIDFDLILEDDVTGMNFSGHLELLEWTYTIKENSSITTGPEFHMQYYNEVELTYAGEVVDASMADFMFRVDPDTLESKLTVKPGPDTEEYSLFAFYNNQEFKGYATGNNQKYELSFTISNETVSLNAYMTDEDGNRFNALQGNISWNMKKFKKQVTVNINSDVPEIQKITGNIIILQKRGLTVNAKFKVKDQNFVGSLRHTSRKKGEGNIIIKAENNIYYPFTTQTKVPYSMQDGEYQGRIIIDLNEQSGWMELEGKLSWEESFGAELRIKTLEFTFTLEGSLDGNFENAILKSAFQFNASEEHLFDLNVIYNDDTSAFSLFAPNFKLDISFERWASKVEFSGFGYGLSTFINFIDGFHVNIGVQDPQKPQRRRQNKKADNLFLFKIDGTLNNLEIAMDVGERIFSIEAEYDFNFEKVSFDGKYFHVYMGTQYNMNMAIQAEQSNDEGSIKAHLTTDFEFHEADLTVNWDFSRPLKSGKFVFTSPIGEAELKAEAEISDEFILVTGEMMSSVHSFQNYSFKLEVGSEGPEPYMHLEVVQGSFTYDIKGNEVIVDGMVKRNLKIHTQNYGVDFGIGSPTQDSQDLPYYASAIVNLSGRTYGFEVNHVHHESWRYQDTQISMITPNKFQFSFMHDLEGRASVFFSHDTSGRLGLSGSIQPSEANTKIELSPDLTYLGGGAFEFTANIPRAMEDGGELKLQRQESDFDFLAFMNLDQKYSGAQIKFVILDSSTGETDRDYSFSYSQKNPRTFIVNGHFDKWEAEMTIKLRGKKTPILTGMVTGKTNIPGYSDINGDWNMGQQSGSYFLETQVSLGDGRDHHLKAEYQMSPFSLKGVYQYGPDSFNIDISSEFNPRDGMMNLKGNIPLPYISDFDIRVTYSFADSYMLNINAIIEEIQFETGFNFGSSFLDGDIVLNLTCPFINPTMARVQWSISGSRITVEGTGTYGIRKGGIKFTLNYNKRYFSYNMSIFTPIDGFSEINLLITNEIIESQMKASVEFSVEQNTFKMNFAIAMDDSSYTLNYDGTFDMYGEHGMVSLDTSFSDTIYSVQAHGKWNTYEQFELNFTLTSNDLHCIVKYGEQELLSLTAQPYIITLHSFFMDSYDFNLNGTYMNDENDNHHVSISVVSSFMELLTMDIIYANRAGHEGTMKVKYGHKKYEVNGKVNFLQKTGIEFRFTSSEDPYHPLNLEASYNFDNFKNGNMKGMEDLADIMFEWGGKFEVKLSGMRRGDRSKVVVELSTPFTALPRLTFGYDGEWTAKKNLTQGTITVFAEWKEKVIFTGSLKAKKKVVEFNCSLTTPFPDIQKVSAGFKWRPGQIEANVTFNEEEWNATCTYDFSSSYSVQVALQTPIEKYETITLMASVNAESDKFNLSIELVWPGEKMMMTIEAEMWRLHASFSSPWTHAQNGILYMLLQTESEELIIDANAVWNEHNSLMKIVISPIRSHLEAKYIENSQEIAGGVFAYNFGAGEYSFRAEVITPVKFYEKTNLVFLWSYSGNYKLEISFARFNWSLNAQNYWKELDFQMMVDYAKSKSPIKIAFRYQVQPEEYKFTSLLEAYPEGSEDKWILIEVNFVDPWTIQASVFNTNMNIVVTKLNPKKYMVKMEITSQELEIDSVIMEAAVDQRKNFSIVSVTSTFNIQYGGVASTHEVVMDYEIVDNHFIMKGELTSEFLDVPYGFTCQVPLIFLSGPGTISFIVTREGEQLYQATYETSYPDHVTKTQKTSHPNDVTMILKVKLTDTEHSLQLKFNEDFSVEKLMFGIELNTPYLLEEHLKFEINFNVQDMFSFDTKVHFSYGSHNLDFMSQFQYNKKFGQFIFDSQVTSSWMSDYSLNLSGMWQRNIVFSTDLAIDENHHTLKVTVETSTQSARIVLDSDWIPYDNLVITGKVNPDFSTSNMNIEGQATTNDGEVIMKLLFKFSETYESRNLNVELTVPNHRDQIISIHNSKTWYQKQDITIKVFGYNFNFNSKLNNRGHIKAGYYEYDSNNDPFKLHLTYNMEDNFEVNAEISTPLSALRFLSFSCNLDLSSSSKMRLYYITPDNKFVFDVKLKPDPSMGWVLSIQCDTPFEGYEHFYLVSPNFDNDGFIVKLEYPGGVVGVELAYDLLEPRLKLILNLPFEEYEVVSLQYSLLNQYDIAVIDARLGKVGVTFSLTYKDIKPHDTGLEFLFRLNEMSIHADVIIDTLLHDFQITNHIEFKPADLFGINTFDVNFAFSDEEHIQMEVKSDQEEYLNLHISWGTNWIFAITTPRTYPGHLVINLQHTQDVSELRMKVGMSLGVDEPWEDYGFHVRQERLEGGQHLSASVNLIDANFYAGGTLSLNAYHLNQSLIFEVNKNRIGYRSLFQIQPGLIWNEYNGDIELILPPQTVRWNTNTKAWSSGDFDLMSSFTWNDLDPQVKPMTLMIDYDDFHSLHAVFSYPSINDIVLHGNITQDKLHSSHHGIFELRNENSNKNMVLEFGVTEYDDMKHTVQATLSQEHSDFTANLEGEFNTKPDNQYGYFVLNYWNFAQHTNESIQFYGNLQSKNDDFSLIYGFVTPNDWEYAYNISTYSRDNKAQFDIISTSKNNFWRILATMNKYLPEVSLNLDIGEVNQMMFEPYEEGRLRVGLHNPMEVGAIIEHSKFNEWKQDFELGFRLKTEEILQFVFEFDPAIDYNDNNFLLHLSSPADQILNRWLQDLSFIYTSTIEKLSSDGPAMAEGILDMQVFMSVWNAESNNFYEMISEFKRAVTDIQGGVEFWMRYIQPAMDAAFEVTSTMQDYTALWKEFISTAGFEWTGMQGFITSITEALMRISNEFGQQYYIMEQRFTAWAQSMGEVMAAQYNNAMYQAVRAMNSLVSTWQRYSFEIQEAIQPYLDSVYDSFMRYGEEMDAIFWGQCYQRLETIFKEALAMEETKWLRTFLQLEEYFSMLQASKDTLMAWAEEAKNIVQDGVQELLTTVKESTVGENFRTFQSNIEAVLAQIRAEGVFNYFEHQIEELGPKILNKGEEAIELLRMNIHNLRRYAQGNLFFDYINAAAGNVYDRMLSTWERWNEEGQYKLQDLERVMLALFDGTQKLLKDTNYFMEESIVFELQLHGRIEYNQYLPVPWNSFLEYPQWEKLTYMFYESPVSKAERLLREERYEMATGWWILSHMTNFRPPFGATATIIGQHITTFDLDHFQFLGPCSYLLTKDFVGGDFEVVGVYGSEGGEVSLQSLMVRGPGTDITLYVDGTVESRSLAGEVISDENYGGVALSGLFITCSKDSPGCAITVSGKYFGRLGGLLGNYNYEPSDDWTRADGSDAWSHSWSVSPETCYQANQAATVYRLQQAEEVDECSRLFLDTDSAFSNCFQAVDPQPYFWHCIHGSNRPHFSNGSTMNEPLCQVVEGYRTQCFAHSIAIDTPMQCGGAVPSMVIEEMPIQIQAGVDPMPMPTAVGTCEVEGRGQVDSGWSQRYENSATEGKADVAFVIEMAGCHKDKDMSKFLKLMRGQMKKSGIRDVRFGLVAINSDDSQVYGFLGDAEIEAILQGNNYDGQKSSDQGYSSVIKAASQLRWRPGVSRTLIQFSCQPCDNQSGELQATLREQNIYYHIVTKMKTEVDGPNPKKSKAMGKKIMGFDSGFAFTVADFAKFKGNNKLRSILQEPSESCVMAAQGSGGSAFNSNKWVTAKALLEKKFLRVLVQRLVVNTQAPECQECQCTGGVDDAKLRCYACSDAPPMLEVPIVVPHEHQQQPQEQSEVETMVEAVDGIQFQNDIAQAIKMDFIEQFVEGNRAFEQIENENDSSSSESESDEDYEQTDQQVDDYDYNYDY